MPELLYAKSSDVILGKRLEQHDIILHESKRMEVGPIAFKMEVLEPGREIGRDSLGDGGLLQLHAPAVVEKAVVSDWSCASGERERGSVKKVERENTEQ
jgi:hypothetical protein